ncbi:MAG: CCA tRNA nucleotidyltransferase [Deltaproteobacteria bacterium]|nr:CCA tRNA nucleotidyltransferase [Deltaproteobacteria bacterium]
MFSRRNVFKALYLLSKEKGVKVYLVGGALRNLYLSRPFEPDIDFVLDDGIDDFPDAAAARLGGKSFILDKETKAARVIVKKGGITPFAPKTYTLDFSPMDGGDIIHDLEKRDFTVNATAVELSSIFEGAELKVIDPCEGIADAEKKVLAATNKRVFKEDPLRCLRAIRLSLQCGLAISPAAFVLLKVSAHLLKNTSVERIRDELLRIFSCAGAAQGLKTIFKTGINDTALPETRGWAGIGLKGYDLLTHSLKTLEEAESFLADFRVEFPRHSKRLARHFSSSIGGVKRGVFLKVCAFFHDMNGADTAMSLAKRLRMSRKLAAGFSSVVKNHHRFFAYAQLKEKNARAKAHFFRAAGGSLGVDVVFIALAHAMATRKRGYPEVKKAAGELLEYYYGVFTRKRQGPILTGAQVMRIFGVSEGPLVGEMLEGISGAVDAGAVTNKKEAVEYIQSRFFPNGQGHGD